MLIADDESMARKRLARLVGAIEGCEVVGEVADAEGALARAHEADVVLLDIHMPGLSGLDAKDLLGGVAVIYVTAHADHAVRAFEQGAVDYVLKPVSAERLARALERVRPPNREPGRLPVQTRKGVVLLAAEEVSHAVVSGELVDVFTDRGRYTTTFRLAELERRLPHLERVHRRALVDLDRVDRLQPTDSGGYIAHMKDGSRVTISRAAARDLRRRLGI